MEFFDSDGLRIAFIDAAPSGEATGVPVLLIHGFASNHAVNWVNTLWVQALTRAGRRVIALDNRGHGQSGKLYEPADYHTSNMARDAINLLDHLGISTVVVMGYSMGARIASFIARDYPERVEAVILGGLGDRLLQPAGLPSGIAEALEAPSLDDVRDFTGRMFRAFAEQTGSDLKALAACIRGSRQHLTGDEAAGIGCPVLVAVGTMDKISGNGEILARHFPRGEFFEIPKRDHNQAVGDRLHRQAVVEFLGRLAVP
ncbi:MAG: alpha/beta hydrolase [Hyphomicrobiales bacterium]|nr:alpha/beta hydrolase [Hyphomicrobiales bacterium]